jgi:hypothetical protein
LPNDKLFAMHVSVDEMREICAAEREHIAQIRANHAAADLAENVLNKTALLLEFAKQRQSISAAKAKAAQLRKDYEIFTFGAPMETDSAADN